MVTNGLAAKSIVQTNSSSRSWWNSD